MRRGVSLLVGILLAALLFAGSAGAVVYPTCPQFGGAVACTMTIQITASVTPVFAAWKNRTYLFMQNTGYTNATPPVVSQNPVWCAISSGNAPTSANSMVIQPGGVYEPYQIVKPQNAFTVLSGDVSCFAPLGDVFLTVEQE